MNRNSPERLTLKRTLTEEVKRKIEKLGGHVRPWDTGLHVTLEGQEYVVIVAVVPQARHLDKEPSPE
jgi:hypothetical protein